MSNEVITTIGSGVSLGMLVIGAFALLSNQLGSLDSRLLRVESSIEAVNTRLSRMEGRLNGVESHIEILREDLSFLTGRRANPGPPATNPE